MGDEYEREFDEMEEDTKESEDEAVHDEDERDDEFEPEYEEDKKAERRDELKETEHEFEPEYDQKEKEKGKDDIEHEQERNKEVPSDDEVRRSPKGELKEPQGEPRQHISTEENKEPIKDALKDKVNRLKEKIIGKDGGVSIKLTDKPPEQVKKKTPNIKIRMNQKLRIPKPPRKSESPPSWFLKWIENTTSTENTGEAPPKDESMFMKSDEELKREVLELLQKQIGMQRKPEDEES